MARDNTDIGRSGEFLAAYILETHGIEVHHVDRAGADLWCKVRGSIFTVQVKSARVARVSNKKTKALYYGYFTPSTTADWYCFVALDRQLILMRRPELVTSTRQRISPIEFNEPNQRRTIEEILNTC